MAEPEPRNTKVISHYYQKGMERCRLYAVRPVAMIEGEHPGCLRLSIQPIERGIVLAEHARVVGWFDADGVEAYSKFMISEGWKMTSRPTGAGWKVSRRTMDDFLREYRECLERLSTMPKSNDWLVLRERAYMVRAEIKKRARRLGVPCPEIGDVPHKCESKAPSPRPCPSPRSRPAAPPMSALR